MRSLLLAGACTLLVGCAAREPLAGRLKSDVTEADLVGREVPPQVAAWPPREARSITLELDVAGAIRVEGTELVSADSDDLEPLHEELRAHAAAFWVERVGADFEASAGELLIRADAATPFRRVLDCVELAARGDVRLWRLRYDLARPDGERGVFELPLPVDDVPAAVEEGAEEPPRFELAIQDDVWRVGPLSLASDAGARLTVLARAFRERHPDAPFVIDAGYLGQRTGAVTVALDALARAGIEGVTFVGARR